MTDVMVIVSKAQFEEQHPRAKIGDVLPIDRYVSTHARLETLRDGGALFLVTVRPPDEALWLVAVLEAPTHDGTAWSGARNVSPVTDLGDLRSDLVFANGKGLSAKPGALGMALQTPRYLAASDVALLRGASSTATGKTRATEPKAKATAKAKPPAPRTTKRAPAAVPAPAALPIDEGDFRTGILDPARAETVASLVRQIVASPDDLTKRAILADLYEEAGDARGRHLRLACELERLDETDPRRLALARAVASLEARGRIAWSSDVRRVGGLNGCSREWGRTPFAFRRGFVEVLTGVPEEVLPDLDAAADVAPICRLALRDCKPADLGTLATHRSLGKLRDLSLSPDDAALELDPLLASRHLERIERLSLKGVLTSDTARRLADHPATAQLVELVLESPRDEGIGVEGLRALLQRGRLASLRRLTLVGQGLGAEGMHLLTELDGLRALTVEADEIGPAGAATVADSTTAASLGSLRLVGCGLGAKGAVAVVGSKRLGALSHLDLSENGIGKKLASVLAAYALPQVTSLALNGSNLKLDGAKALAETRVLAGLTRLALAKNVFKHEGAALLATAEGLPRLEVLDLGHNTIDPFGWKCLASGPLLANVRELDLSHNKCGTEGGKELAKWAGLSELRSLRLSYNWMGVLGIRAILERAPRLEELYAGENNYGSEPVRAVAAGACPRLRTLEAHECDAPTAALLENAPAAKTLEDLALGAGAADEAFATALASLPSLGRLKLSFRTPTPAAAAILRRRFGPFLELWGHVDAWLEHPGPP